MKSTPFPVRYFVGIFWIFFIAGPSCASILELSSENYYVPIRLRFSGNALVLYGATDIKGTIIVTIQGVDATFTLKKKQKLYGIWTERIIAEAKNIPSFYMLVSSKPVNVNIYKNSMYEGAIGAIGIKNTHHDIKILSGREKKDFLWSRIIAENRRNGKYVYVPNGIKRLGKYLFSATIPFPPNISVGMYKVNAFVQTEGKKIKGLYSKSMYVGRDGIVKYIYSFAIKYPVLYGFFTIILTLGIGIISGYRKK